MTLLNFAPWWATLIIALLWYCYCRCDGAVDAMNFDKPPSKSLNKLPFGPLKVVMRLCPLFGIGMVCGVVALVSAALVYPFFHNGTYFTTRNHLNEAAYPKKWWATTSGTSDAIVSVGPRMRTILLCIGAVAGAVVTLLPWVR